MSLLAQLLSGGQHQIDGVGSALQHLVAGNPQPQQQAPPSHMQGSAQPLQASASPAGYASTLQPQQHFNQQQLQPDVHMNSLAALVQAYTPQQQQPSNAQLDAYDRQMQAMTPAQARQEIGYDQPIHVTPAPPLPRNFVPRR